MHDSCLFEARLRVGGVEASPFPKSALSGAQVLVSTDVRILDRGAVAVAVVRSTLGAAKPWQQGVLKSGPQQSVTIIKVPHGSTPGI